MNFFSHRGRVYLDRPFFTIKDMILVTGHWPQDANEVSTSI